MTAETTQDVYSLPEYAAFLAAIRAQPADDTPRLVVADWLQERGEDERAEFIRVQCEIARTTSPPFRHVLREQKLRPRLMSQFLPATCAPLNGVPPYSGEYGGPVSGRFGAVVPGDAAGFFWTSETRRGFVSHVTCTAADWLAHADALLARHPVERVTLTTWPTRAELANELCRRHQHDPARGVLADRARMKVEILALRISTGNVPYMDGYRNVFAAGPWKGVLFDPPSLPVPA